MNIEYGEVDRGCHAALSGNFTLPRPTFVHLSLPNAANVPDVHNINLKKSQSHY